MASGKEMERKTDHAILKRFHKWVLDGAEMVFLFACGSYLCKLGGNLLHVYHVGCASPLCRCVVPDFIVDICEGRGPAKAQCAPV